MHMRWMLEAQEKKISTAPVIRFVGGGALSDETCRILADVLGRVVETVENPQNVGAVGATVILAVGLGVIPSLEAARDLIPAVKTYLPNPENKKIYDRNFTVFKNLYKNNCKNFAALNRK